MIVLTPDRLNQVKSTKNADFFDYDKWIPNDIHICTPRPKEKVFKKEMRKRPTPLWRL